MIDSRTISGTSFLLGKKKDPRISGSRGGVMFAVMPLHLMRPGILVSVRPDERIRDSAASAFIRTGWVKIRLTLMNQFFPTRTVIIRMIMIMTSRTGCCQNHELDTPRSVQNSFSSDSIIRSRPLVQNSFQIFLGCLPWVRRHRCPKTLLFL